MAFTCIHCELGIVVGRFAVDACVTVPPVVRCDETAHFWKVLAEILHVTCTAIIITFRRGAQRVLFVQVVCNTLLCVGDDSTRTGEHSLLIQVEMVEEGLVLHDLLTIIP